MGKPKGKGTGRGKRPGESKLSPSKQKAIADRQARCRSLSAGKPKSPARHYLEQRP